MSSDEPLGHAERLDELWRAAREERLAHALVLVGPEGIGKFLAARWLAQGLFCVAGPGPPCGRCGPCKRVASGNHPDLLVLDARAEGREHLRVGRIARREDDGDGPSVEEFLALRPHEGGWRVVLVREAERMNEAAQNAFLKTLEEPRPATLILLETAQVESLLATVRSRLVAVPLAPLPAECTAAVLERHGLTGEDLELLTRWCGGAPGRALALAARGAPAMRRLLADVVSGARPALGAARELWQLEGTFEGGTPSARARERARALFDVGLELFGDAQRAAAGRTPAGLAHGDLAATLGGRPEGERRRWMDRWLAARQDVERNVAPEALVDRALAVLERS